MNTARIRAVARLILLFGLSGFAAHAQSPEEELGPKKMALADAIVARVIDGIRYEGLRGERIEAAIRAWTDYHIRRREISQRDSTIMQLYARRAAQRYRQGIPHVPWAERQARE